MSLVITLDLDWACEPAIEETLDHLAKMEVRPTVFVTHRSPRVEAVMDQIEVGLHPFFDPHSSHGSTIAETIDYVTDLPHNFPGFRSHRFAISNAIRLAMVEAGMLVSSNVCTDLEILPPFRDRFGLWEVPIFLEDGGYLWQKHPLSLHPGLFKEGVKVLLIHPMHFAINTPHFDYMVEIKRSMSRQAWNQMTQKQLSELRWHGRGIRDLIVEWIEASQGTLLLSDVVSHNLLSRQPESQKKSVPFAGSSQNPHEDIATDRG